MEWQIWILMCFYSCSIIFAVRQLIKFRKHCKQNREAFWAERYTQKCLVCGDSGYDDYDLNGDPISFCEDCDINARTGANP